MKLVAESVEISMSFSLSKFKRIPSLRTNTGSNSKIQPPTQNLLEAGDKATQSSSILVM